MELLPNLLRGIVSAVMNIVLILSLLQPKYSKWVTISSLLLVLGLDVGVSVGCYMYGSLSQLAVLDIIIAAALCLLLRPLFKDGFAQWLFGYITVQNVSMVVVSLSFIISRHLPFPEYSNTLVRLLLFGIAIYVLRGRLYPIYQQVVEHQVAFVYVAVVIFVNFAYYFVAGSDIVEVLATQTVPILMLILLSVTCYLFIFHLMESTLKQYELNAHKLKAESRQELLQSELSAQDYFVSVARKNRHDLRHHNALLLGMLDNGDVEGARNYLRQYNDTIAMAALQQYCKNPTANAVLRLYSRRAEQNNIDCSINANIPAQLPLTAPEISELFSNLMENACEACEKSDSEERFITLNVKVEEQSLILELCNMVSGQTEFDDEGIPHSSKKNGGIGVHSANAIVQKYGGILSFKQQNGVFYTRMLLPIGTQEMENSIIY